MPKVERTMVVRAPIEEVFAALTEPRRIVEWNPNIVEIRNVSPQPVQEGTTWQQVAMVAGRPAELTCTVSLYQPPNEGVLSITGSYTGRTWTRCEQVPEGTRVTQGIEVEPPGGIAGKAIGKLIAPALEKELNRTMERQRAALETAGGSAAS